MHSSLSGVSAKPVAVAPSEMRYSLLASDTGSAGVARRMLAAMDTGDCKALLEMAHPDEIEQLHLTPAKLAAFNNLYLDAKKGFVPRGISEIRETRTGGMCGELFTFHGHEVVINGVAIPTRTGFRGCVTPTILSAIIQLKVARQSFGDVPSERTPGKTMGMVGKMYRDIKAVLEPAGYDGLMFTSNQKGGLKKMGWRMILRPRRRPEPPPGAPLPRAS